VNPAGVSSIVVTAGRNATITSLMVCCGFIICWTPNAVLYFLTHVGYPVDYGGWFYHFTGEVSPCSCPETLLKNLSDALVFDNLVLVLALVLR